MEKYLTAFPIFVWSPWLSRAVNSTCNFSLFLSLKIFFGFFSVNQMNCMILTKLVAYTYDVNFFYLFEKPYFRKIFMTMFKGIENNLFNYRTGQVSGSFFVSRFLFLLFVLRWKVVRESFNLRVVQFKEEKNFFLKIGINNSFHTFNRLL